jgi:hypothetical protein
MNLRERRSPDAADDPPVNHDVTAPEEFATAYPESLIITTGRQMAGLLARLPSDYRVIVRVPHLLRDEELVLLARPSQPGSRDPRRRTAESGNDSIR